MTEPVDFETWKSDTLSIIEELIDQLGKEIIAHSKSRIVDRMRGWAQAQLHQVHGKIGLLVEGKRE